MNPTPTINYNGKILPADQTILSAQNRAFRYGDGLFESLRVNNGHIPFLRHHFLRLYSGLTVLEIDLPSGLSIDFFRKEILKLTGENKLARVRFTAFRADGGLYLPSENGLQFLIESKPLLQPNFQLNPLGIRCELYHRIPLYFNVLSPIKSINALPYILASKYKEKIALDDVLLINQHGRLAEASSSNIFVWDGEKLMTPPLSEACVAGVIRAVLLEKSEEFGLVCLEKEIEVEDLNVAKAVFLTNSIQGLKWLGTFSETVFEEGVAKDVGGRIVEILNELGRKEG